MIKIKFTAIAITIFLFACSNNVFACPNEITEDSYIDMFFAKTAEQYKFFDELKNCLPGNEKLQEELDTVATSALDSTDCLPKDAQKPMIYFSAIMLQINADAGYASSQHNYAVLNNALPGSLEQRLYPQDYNAFIYWTRKAATQKEPRALFNLAVRLASNDPKTLVNYDPKTAYIIFTYLVNTYSHSDHEPLNQIVARSTQFRKQLTLQLGHQETELLDKKVAQFNFSSLAPNKNPAYRGVSA